MINQHYKSCNFEVDKKHGKPPKRYKDEEQEALLDKNDSQKQLAEKLSISQQAVSNCLQEKGKIQD